MIFYFKNSCSFMKDTHFKTNKKIIRVYSRNSLTFLLAPFADQQI